MRPLLALCPIALAGCMTGGEPADRALAATLDTSGQRYGDGAVKAGPAEDCIQTSQIRSTRVRGNDAIDFEMTGGRVYRNILPGGCPSLGSERRFAYATSISRLCSIDLITILESPDLSRGPSCGLGRFQPIDRAPR